MIQIASGYEHSMVMLEERRIVWFGTNGSIHFQSKPKLINLEERIPELLKWEGASTGHKGFGTVKIWSSWSRSLSVTYLSMADTRNMSTLSEPKRASALNQVAGKWDNLFLDPPYIQAVAGLFSVSNMRKSKTSPKKLHIRALSPISRLDSVLRSGVKYQLPEYQKYIYCIYIIILIESCSRRPRVFRPS